MFKYIEEMTLECPGCGEQIHKEFQCSRWDKGIELANGSSEWKYITCEDCNLTFMARAKFEVQIVQQKV